MILSDVPSYRGILCFITFSKTIPNYLYSIFGQVDQKVTAAAWSEVADLEGFCLQYSVLTIISGLR